MAIKFKLSDEEKKKINKIATAMEEEKQVTRETEVSQDLPTAKLSRLSERNNSYSSRTKYPYTNKYGKGNIDLTNRPIVKNDDGSISTVRSMSFQDEEGKEVLVPTVVNGKIVSDSEAINNYYRTGEYLGKFDSVEEANEYAEKLHKQQEKLYSQNSRESLKLPYDLPMANQATANMSDATPAELAKNNVPVVSSKDSRLALARKKAWEYNTDDYKNLTELNQVAQQKQADAINEIAEDHPIKAGLLNTGLNLAGGMLQSVGGFIDASKTIEATMAKGTGAVAGFLGNKDIEEKSKKAYEKAVAEGGYTNSSFNTIASGNQGVENGAIKTIGSVASTMGRQLMDALLGEAIGTSGSTLQGIGVAGSSSQEVLAENPDNIAQAVITGTTKGIVAKKLEDLFDANILTIRGSKSSVQNQVTNWISNTFRSKVGKEIANRVTGVAGENIEEFLEDNIDNIIDKLVNNKDLPSFEEWWNNTKETAKVTTISTIAMNLLGLGGESFAEKEAKLDSETNFWINEAQKVIKEDGYITQEQQTTNQANNNTNVERNLPTVNTENTYSNQLKQMASKEITNSNISEDYKSMMLDVLNNMNEVSDADVGSIRQNINSLEEANRLDTKIDSKNDQTRRKKYIQYKNDTNTYDSTEVNEVLDMTPTNRNGRRTVKQWLTVADEIGKRIANKSNAEIEQIAYKSWFDIEPSKSITQYDSQSKTSVAFQKFTSDEWVNTINNAVNKTRSSQNIPNSIEKNNIKEYNNLQLGETKNINTNDLSQLAKDGGHRTTEQIESLRESIRQNGIVEPIEIYRKNDGTFAIENGNHRLKIASELGIEQVPVKLVESWENLGLVKDKTETNILNEGIDRSDTSNRISEANIENDEGSGTGRRSVYDINDKFKNGRTAEKNVEISEGTPNSNQQTSNIKNEGNNRKQGVDNSTSFNMNESSKTQDTSNELETGEWTKQKKEGEKRRKHYESIIKSNYTTDEAKAIAKSLMGTDTYVPESNSKQLELADDRVSTTGADSELASLLSRATTGGTIKAEDIAIGERLIQYYSKTGNKTKLQDAIQATAMAGTTAGQTVQAMSLLNHQTPEGQAVWLQRSVDKMNKDLKRTRGEDAEQFKLTPEMLNKITNSENAKVLEQNLNEVYKELGQQVTKTTAQKIDAWRYFSMLANPRTHIRNIVGNTAMGGVQGIKNKVAGGIESAVSKINPYMERNHTVIPASKEVKAFAKADIENVVDRLGLNENKYNPKTRLENNMRTFKSDAMENTIGKAFDLNNKALEAEDGWGLKAGYVKALSEYMTANKLTPDTITDQQLGKARNFAIEQAKEATFHQDSQLASLINQLSNKNKFSKFVLDATLPFKKTPINVAKAGLEYSPVGLVKSAVYDTAQLRKGNITANKYIDNISKGLTGTGIALVGYALANCGVLKATGSDDEDKEKFEEGRGSQNYAITIGNNTYSLDWLAPSGIPLFIGAECYELMKAQKEKKTSSSDEDEYYNKVINASMNILDSFTNAMNPMTEMSMLSGLTSALKSYDQGSSKMLAGIGTNSIKSYVNQFIPTALGQIAKTTDEYERNTTSTKTGVLPKAIDTTRTQIMNKIPGLRQKLPIKTDIWGQEQKQSDNIALRALENAVFPWARKELNSNNVDKEITKVYENTGESSVFPDTINKNLTIDKKKYVMTSKEFAKYKKQFGETSYELLKNLINSDGYKKLSDSQKQLAIEKVYSYSTEQIKIDYARQNCLKNEQSTLSQVTNAIKKAGGNTSNYFEFLANTQGLDKDSEKLEVLANSKYNEKTKKAIYENSLGKKDTKYDIVKESFTGSGLNMSKYLQYKAQEFKADKKDDGTVNGKSITGSKKDKVFDYIDSIKGATYTQKLILYALEYKPSSSSDREIVENYVRNMPNRTVKEKLEIMSKFAGVTVYKNNSYTY